MFKNSLLVLIALSAVAAQAGAAPNPDMQTWPVPDTGSTLLLLGGATVLLGLVRRFRKQ